VGNPVDMVASATPDAYRQAVEAALTADDADALIIIYTPVDPRSQQQTLQAIRGGIAAARRTGATQKPVLTCLMAGSAHPRPLEADGERLPCYAFPENCARALAKIATYAEWRAQPPALLWTFDDIRVDEARAVCHRALASAGEGWLNGEELASVLGAFGVPLAAGMLARSREEAAAAARVIGFPVAAKLATRTLQHKTDVGVVQLNLANEAAVERAFSEIMTRGRALVSDAGIDGVLIQAMVHGGIETMVGISTDPLFGPLVAFGLGGIHVEILGDVGFRMAPLTDKDADELLHEIKGARLLDGYRGHPPADLDALRELLLRVSRLAVDVPEIAEVDLNPVMAMSPGHGCRIVDARIKIKSLQP
jgi:acyl-CoA synthetase (NDP forming)